MQDIIKNSRIYLSGGGNEKQSFLLDKYFFDKLSQKEHFLYIPVALRDSELYPTANLWMKSVLELHKKTDLDFETVDDLSKYQLNDIKVFGALYIGGGNTWNLIKELKESGFSNKLVQYLKEGGCIYGGSAGAIVLGKRLDTHDDENKTNLKDTSGFNLLYGYSIAPHFKDEQSDRFKNWAIHNKSPIICLPEETGLIIEEDSALCVGTKSCVIYFSDGARKEIHPEESFKL